MENISQISILLDKTSYSSCDTVKGEINMSITYPIMASQLYLKINGIESIKLDPLGSNTPKELRTIIQKKTLDNYFRQSDINVDPNINPFTELDYSETEIQSSRCQSFATPMKCKILTFPLVTPSPNKNALNKQNLIFEKDVLIKE